MEDDGEWWNWSKPEYRGEPFDTAVQTGDMVHVEYAEADSGKVYISTISKVTTASPTPPPVEFNASGEYTADPIPVPATTPPTKPVVAGKDILMAKMNAIRTTGELYAACITVGLIKELPTPSTIKAYAEAIEAKLD